MIRQKARYLLDVNAVLALLDPQHLFHDAVHRWGDANPEALWLMCPLVQNGVLRVASQPRYPNSPGPVTVVRELLRAFAAHPRHEFVHDSVSMLDDAVSNPGFITPATVTDAYLLLLAERSGAKLATFDRRMPVGAISGGASLVERIPV